MELDVPPPTSYPPFPTNVHPPFDDQRHTEHDMELYALPSSIPQPADIADIYRGLGYAPHSQPNSPRPSLQHFNPGDMIVGSSSSSSTSSTDSSSSSGRGRGIGVIANLVERAITRWARGRSSSTSSSTSSSSSSTSSSRSGAQTHSRTHSRPRHRSRSRRRRSMNRRRRSMTTISSYSPTRIARARQLLEQSRRIPREFILFLPAALTPIGQAHPPTDSTASRSELVQEQAQQQRIIRTSSASLIVAQLESALRRSGKRIRKDRGPRHIRHTAECVTSPGSPSPPAATPGGSGSSTPAQVDPNHATLPVVFVTNSTPPSSVADLKKWAKGKGKMSHSLKPEGVNPIGHPRKRVLVPGHHHRAWWLDVASPSWDDMRALGKLLRLHPLTLEDILQQEPREKLELFPRLGYYFIVFKAIESQATRAHLNRSAAIGAGAGSVAAVTVYIVVFREGICSFHFQDISEHVDGVRNRILQFEETIPMTSDWIAHRLMDSIVDAFMPVIQDIEREVDQLDSIVSGIEQEGEDHNIPVSITVVDPDDRTLVEKQLPSPTQELHFIEEKSTSTAQTLASAAPPAKKSSSRKQSFFKMFRRFSFAKLRFLQRLLPKKFRRSSTQQRPSARYNTLLRMAACRRLVTALTRLLGPKSEVVAQVRKRVVLSGGVGGVGPNSGMELGIYLGDVQDHIITMQQALAHYERILSHSHPAYLSFLRYSLSEAKGGMDKAILALSLVTICFLTTQVITTLFGTNINVPHNLKQPGGSYHVFGIVVALVTVAAFGVLFLCRWWWLKAKRRGVSM